MVFYTEKNACVRVQTESVLFASSSNLSWRRFIIAVFFSIVEDIVMRFGWTGMDREVVCLGVSSGEIWIQCWKRTV
jgi:hypothetical protein